MSKAENFERYLLKSLIEDLDASSFPDCCFKEKENIFSSQPDTPKTNVTCSLDLLADTMSKSEESVNKFNYPADISKEEIWNALGDQKSTLNLQKNIKDFSSEDITPMLEEIKGSLGKMMVNRNGNYLCKDLFKICNSTQRLSMLQEIAPNFELISNNEFGTHPVQALIENAKTPEEINAIINAVSSKRTIIKLSQNTNGSYVIQKIISNIPESSRGEFNVLLINCLSILAVNMYGVCIIKKFICFCQNKKLISQILSIIANDFFMISENQYGNYFIQSMLDLWWNKKEMTSFKELVYQCFFRLATNQYGSHIAETFINLLSIADKGYLLINLMQIGSYYYLANDKYGMFVMNKLVNSIQRVNRSRHSNNAFDK